MQAIEALPSLELEGYPHFAIEGHSRFPGQPVLTA